MLQEGNKTSMFCATTKNMKIPYQFIKLSWLKGKLEILQYSSKKARNTAASTSDIQ